MNNDVLQLLQSEARIYEALKVGKSIGLIAADLGVTYNAAHQRIERLIALKIIIRTGDKKNYKYIVPDVPYEIIKRRNLPPPAILGEQDKLLQDAMQFRPNKKQSQYLKKNRNKLGRSEMAKHLGISRLQLNFAFIKL